MYIAKTTAYKQQQDMVSLKHKEASEKNVKKEDGEKAVSLELSEEGRALSRKDEEREELEKLKSYWEAFREKKKKEQSPLGRMLKNRQGAGKKKRSNNALSKALMIARRIMRGDKVPPKDESFLFRYNSDLYLKAKMMAIQNQEIKKHKSLLEDEEGSTEMSMSGGSSPVHVEGGGDPGGDTPSEGEQESAEA